MGCFLSDVQFLVVVAPGNPDLIGIERSRGHTDAALAFHFEVDGAGAGGAGAEAAEGKNLSRRERGRLQYQLLGAGERGVLENGLINVGARTIGRGGPPADS